MAGGDAHGTKAVVAALFANAGIAVAKFVGFGVTGSSSMLAEGVHSVADSGNQALLLLGHRRAKKPASNVHDFGYGRERYFWSFVVALVLFSLGSLFAIYEGVHKISDPHEIDSPGWAIGILAFAIVVEAFSFRTAIVETNKVKGDASYRSFIRHSKSPELPVVLLEDLGAQVGLVFALIAVIVAVVTGNGVWDGYGTLSIGILLGVIAIVLAVEMKSLLIGESASSDDEREIETAITGQSEVVGLIHLRTQHIGPDELLVGAKVEFDHQLTLPQLTEAIDRLEETVRERVPAARVMYVEPDVTRSS